jgi:hypothetical protein
MHGQPDIQKINTFLTVQSSCAEDLISRYAERVDPLTDDTAVILGSSFSKAHRIVLFLRNIALGHHITISHFVLNAACSTTAHAEE